MLLVLKDAKPKLRKAILKNCDEETIKTIIEIVMNALHGNFKTSKKEKNQLKKYKRQLRKLGSYSTKNCSLKRQVILQNGGAFLPTIISSLLPHILSRLIKDA